MSRLQKALLACLALVLCLGMIGCADQTDEANALIDQANAATDESNRLDGLMTELMAKVEQIDPTAKNARDAQPLLTEVEAKLSETQKNAERTLLLWDKILALDVSDELKTYAAQQKEIAKLQVALSAAVGDMVVKLKVLYDPDQTGKLSQADFDKLAAELDGLVAKADEIDSQMSEKQGASDQYFKDNGLGE